MKARLSLNLKYTAVDDPEVLAFAEDLDQRKGYGSFHRFCVQAVARAIARKERRRERRRILVELVAEIHQVVMRGGVVSASPSPDVSVQPSAATVPVLVDNDFFNT